jgi:hypothetical protein
MLKRSFHIGTIIAFLVSFTALFLAVVFFMALPLSAVEEGYPAFDREGRLIRPKGYRTWVFVGATVTPNELNGGRAAFPEFHNVYMNPVSYRLYKKTGKFRDGTILLKERVSVGAKRAASGNGYFPGTYLGLEATVKDSRRFSREPGHWAYFSFALGEKKTLTDKAEAFPARACNACHEQNAAGDWVFTQYYPVLKEVRPGE